MAIDTKTRRLMSAAYVLAKHRAERKHHADIECLADRFEAVNAETVSEIRELRHEIARAHAIADFAAVDYEETRTLH
jgi:hypothetical protein